MPTTSIQVNKQSVKELLESGKSHPFVIPEYQRPYAWDDDQIQILFDDLWNFTINTENVIQGKQTYFLGSVVSYENDDGEQEIIDGQQRITSLFLLLRTIYTALQDSAPTPQVHHLMRQIEPALWQTDPYTGNAEFSKTLLTSRVLNNTGNQILHDILKTGKADLIADDNYSRNYRKFQEIYAEKSKNNSINIRDFILVILQKAILLPITADSQDTALTIFSTLNDRGLPLSDADIFKAKLYNYVADKKTFIAQWQDLDEAASSAKESIQHLFYYYMFYLRGTEKDTRSSIVGIRSYYSENGFMRLYQPRLLDDLFTITKLWSVVNKKETIAGESWSSDIKVLQALDILKDYPNEYWKYPVINYYLKHKSAVDFTEKFNKFLRKLLRELLIRYLNTPTVNAIKNDILRLNAAIIEEIKPEFDFRQIDINQLGTRIITPHAKSVRMLLKILAYERQTALLPDSWEIEHILPYKWQVSYFSNYPEDIIKEKIEHLGNKLPFEKRLNIMAGNGYFQKKQQNYAKSQITITRETASLAVADWDVDCIIRRDVRVSDKILAALNEWDTTY